MRTVRHLRSMLLGCAAAACAAAPGAHGAELAFARATEHSSIDPHFSQTGPNNATATAVFERLVSFDAKLQMHPGLAESWTLRDPLTWDIRLRPGVRFHDGTPLSAEDVVFSLGRVRHIVRSPAPWTHAVTNVASAEATGPLTLTIRTAAPTPLLMEQVGLIYVVPAKVGLAAGNEEFNSGRAAWGTGPYRYRSWTPGDRAVLEANGEYWGGKPEWDKVTLRFIASGAARVAALLSGEVDLIDSVAPADAAGLGRNPAVAVHSSPTNRLIYLAVDAARDASPFVTGADGRPLGTNPLRDPRVRRALSMMINREGIAARVLNGAAEPAGQVVPEGEGGYVAGLGPASFDPAAARALLAEAGYRDGFGITLHSSSDRYPGDAQVAQAVGQMLARGGMRVNGVEALPYNVYAPAATDRRYSLFLFGWSSSTGNSSEALRSVLATWDPANGLGALNRARYSNPAFDALLAQASQEFDEGRRNGLLAEATRLAMEDGALLPLYWQKAIWASRRPVAFDANMSEDSSVLFAHPGR